MAKFKTLIQQLSDKDYEAIRRSLIDNHAGKSVTLLETVRKHNPTDESLMKTLNTKGNAYYALRSRLNQRIEAYLVQQMENPRTDIMRKVMMINEVMFTKSPEIAIATLKKLEKELIEYDLSNELTVVYKSLKKLTMHGPEHFQYSQLYNRHIAYTLALDKAEDMLAEYLKKYGEYLLNGDEEMKLQLTLMKREMRNVCALYPSHRLFILNNCLDIFHRLFVIDEQSDDETPTEDLLISSEKILASYPKDSTYFHLKTVFDFFWVSYYEHFGVHRKVENYFAEVNIRSPLLLSNFQHFTFPSNFLILKLKRAIRRGVEWELHGQNTSLYEDLYIDKNDVPQYYVHATYFALCAYLASDFKEAIRWLTELVNDVNWKQFPKAMLEARMMLVFLHFMVREPEYLNVASSSIQRQIRVIGKENCPMGFLYYRLMKTAINSRHATKPDRVRELVQELNHVQPDYYSPLKYIRIDDFIVQRLSAPVVTKAAKS